MSRLHVWNLIYVIYICYVNTLLYTITQKIWFSFVSFMTVLSTCCKKTIHVKFNALPFKEKSIFYEAR